MNKNTLLASSLLLPVFVLAAPVTPTAHSLRDALTQGKTSVYFRLRNETAIQGNTLKNANATTLLTELGFQTAPYYGVDAQLQFANTSQIGSRHYNDTVQAGYSNYTIIPDPNSTRILQAYVGLAPSAKLKTQLKIGRQLINLDDQRFIGAVAFRQNWQNFNAVTLKSTRLKFTTLQAGYMNRVQTIWGSRSRRRAYKANDFYAHVVVAPWKYLQARAYDYWLEDKATSINSLDTLGGALFGTASITPTISVNYSVEYAHQKNYKNNPNSYSDWYRSLMLGATGYGLTAKVAQQVLRSQGTVATAFRTPLGTNHKFQGWADLFLTTPASGLEDNHATLSYKLQHLGNTLLGYTYHHFDEQHGKSELGYENDVWVNKPFKHANLNITYANFRSKVTSLVNTQRLWLTALVKFDV